MPDTNTKFARWTRRTAFSLTLNETGISNLLNLLDWEDKLRDPTCELHGPGRLLPPGPCDPDQYGSALFNRGEANYLEKRGLIRLAAKIRQNPADEWRWGSGVNYVLTEVGTHVARMLACAGFKNHYHHESNRDDSAVACMEVP